MNSMKSIKIGLATLTALSSVLIASQASALSCTNNASVNKSSITIHPWMFGMVGGLYISNFYADNQFRYPPGFGNSACKIPAATGPVHTPAYPFPNMLCNDSPTNSGGTTNADYINTGADVSRSIARYPQTLPVVCSLTAPPTYQSGNIVTNILYTSGSKVNNGTVIGLAGAYKIKSWVDANNSGTAYDPINPVKSVRWGKLSLVKDADLGWILVDGLNNAKIFQFVGITETVTGTPPNRKLTLSGGQFKFGSVEGSLEGWGTWLSNEGLMNQDNTPVTYSQLDSTPVSLGFNTTVNF